MANKKIGGAREGAGRPATGRTKVNVTLTLTPESKAKLKELGGSKWLELYLKERSK